MNSNNNLNKLFFGACGTQVGLLVGLTSLVFVGGICSLCLFSNAVTFGVSQEFANVSTRPPSTRPSSARLTIPDSNEPNSDDNLPSSSEDIDTVQREIDLLLEEVELLRAEADSPTTASAISKPIAVAIQNGVTLRSGPATNYPQIGRLTAGDTLNIVGRDQVSSWWLVSTDDGSFAWVSGTMVTALNVPSDLPVVTIPGLLVQADTPASNANVVLSAMEEPAVTSQTMSVVVGTPTPGAGIARTFVEDMPSYKRVRGHLLVPPVSASISPDGSQIALTERIKLYTVATDGAHTRIWLEDNDKRGPIGDVVWSPDGQYLAFGIGFKQQYCQPCRGVAILDMSDETITVLQNPEPNLDIDAPRWTQDGRLLVHGYVGEPANGTTYVYDIASGESQIALGTYQLSASHEGQKWYPWHPGKSWLAGVTERADTYYRD